MIRSLPVRQNFQHPVGIEHPARDDVRHQELRLREGQGRSVFSNRPVSRTRNARAKMTRVI